MLKVKMEADSVIRNLQAVTDNLPKQLAIVNNKSAKRTKSFIAKGVTKELAVKQKTVKEHIQVSKPDEIKRHVDLFKSKRLGLRHFNARQLKSGVSYRISKTQGRKKIPGAFQGPKPGVLKVSWKGNAFKRQGKSRLPIYKLQGPSPFGVLDKHPNRIKAIARLSKYYQRKQMLERIRYLKLRNAGTI